MEEVVIGEVREVRDGEQQEGAGVDGVADEESQPLPSTSEVREIGYQFSTRSTPCPQTLSEGLTYERDSQQL